jgi:phospholipid/cholesterol/gamma-HCH transport system substrate-binding protein
MRSRTIREGSVGLLILLGLGTFGAILLWLRGLSLGNRSYQVVVNFPSAVGMQTGSSVRYRGVVVGRVQKIRPADQFAEVEMQISPGTLKIPRDSLIQSNQAGLIGETAVDITPITELTSEVATNPFAADCKGSAIICDGDRLRGEVGVTFDALISSTIRLSNQLADPILFGNIQSLTRNSSRAAAGVTTLAGEVTTLTKSVQQELRVLSGSANATTTAVGQAANEIGLTAAQVNSLITSNRSAINSTLLNVNETSSQLRVVATRLAPLVEEGEFVQNLQALSTNAARASATFRTLTDSLGSPENALMLQQTLDSARATFQNAEKITSDLDELTGDPAVRSNIRDLIQGLENLLSSTQQLQQQTDFDQLLIPAAIALQNPEPPPLASSPAAVQVPRRSPAPTLPATPLPTGSAAPHAPTPLPRLSRFPAANMQEPLVPSPEP